MMTVRQDQHYIDLVKQGDARAFTVLVDRYKDLVFTLALRTIQNREVAEEVAQDTFLKVFRAIDQFKGDSKFSTWIFRIAYNTCLDSIKSNGRGKVRIIERTENDFDMDAFEAADLENTLDVMEAEEQAQLIQDCLHRLEADESFLLSLYYFDDMSVKEISKVIDLSVSNVKIKLFRSRQKLAGILRKHVEPDIIQYYEK